MKKIILLKGLPASGKSTWAKEQVGYKRINKDDLRKMIDDSKWSKGNEKLIIEARNSLLKTFMFNGENIIIDDTNFEDKHRKEIEDIIIFHNAFYDKYSYKLEEKFFDTPVDECIERDSKRFKTVGKKVIMGMYNKYLRKEPTPIPYNAELPECIICDLDGTLAKKGDRDIYDGSKCHLDTVIEPVALTVRRYLGTTIDVIFMSGRDVEHMGVTEKWLCDNGLVGGELIMRKDGDKRSDDIVKKELFEEYIKDRYNVLFVIDDRKKVKKMWVDQGLFVFDVNQLDEEY